MEWLWGGCIGSAIPNQTGNYNEFWGIISRQGSDNIVVYCCLQGASVSRHLSYYPPTGTDKSVSDDEDADSVHSKSSMESGVEPYERSGRTRGR